MPAVKGESTNSSPKRPEDFLVCKRLFTAGGGEKTKNEVVDDQDDLVKLYDTLNETINSDIGDDDYMELEKRQSNHLFMTDDESDSERSLSDGEHLIQILKID